MVKRPLHILLFFIGLFLLPAANALETVTLQLKWKHQFQFAGYYAAREMGFYQDVGLDVIIKEAAAGIDPVEQVLAGDANFGVGTSELVLSHADGKPVVVLAVVFQHSPLGLVISKKQDLTTLQDIVGQKIMIEPNSAELFAYLELEGIEKEKLDIVEHTFDIEDLVSGKIAAMSVYVTDEPFSLRAKNHQYALFEPRLGGIDFYGDNLFTTQAEFKSNPERTQKFREATLKGWKYAMQNTEEIIQLIYTRYSQRHSIEHLRYEARQMKRLMQPSLVEPGYMHKGRWEHIVRTYQSQGKLPIDYTLEGFLYHPDDAIDVNQLKPWIFLGSLVMIILMIGITLIVKLNQKANSIKLWLDTIVTNAPSALIISDRQGVIKDWNAKAEETFGWTEEEVRGKNAFELLLNQSNIESVKKFIDESFSTKDAVKSTVWNITKSRKAILCEWKNAIIYSHGKDKEYVVSMAIDITKQKQSEDKLKLRAYTDQLTGLNNRHIFYMKFAQAIKQAKRHNRKLATLFIDLDGFKSINDSYGHEAGDLVLKVVSQRIKDNCRETDITARLGGDEFAILLDDAKNEDVIKKVAQNLLKAIIKPIELDQDKLIAIGASIGISLYPEHGNQAEKLLKVADLAMYEVKQGSKDNLNIAEVKEK